MKSHLVRYQIPEESFDQKDHTNRFYAPLRQHHFRSNCYSIAKCLC